MERGRIREGCALFLWERFEAKAFAGTKIIASCKRLGYPL